MLIGKRRIFQIYPDNGYFIWMVVLSCESNFAGSILRIL
jgi:hypothetical protein